MNDISAKKISPSIMCADFFKLEETLRSFEQSNIECIHVDIMDGNFVPNFTLGTDFCKALRKATNIPLDLHLMVNNPEEKLMWFGIDAGEYVSVHYESTPHICRVLQKIKDLGGKPFIALNPGTPLCVLENLIGLIDGVLIMTVNPGFSGQKLIPGMIEKIKLTREFLDNRGYSHVEIEVDGNVSFENARKMSDAGANIFVAGTSSMFHSDFSLCEGAERLRRAVE